jgi:hypothetical protein
LSQPLGPCPARARGIGADTAFALHKTRGNPDSKILLPRMIFLWPKIMIRVVMCLRHNFASEKLHFLTHCTKWVVTGMSSVDTHSYDPDQSNYNCALDYFKPNSYERVSNTDDTMLCLYGERTVRIKMAMRVETNMPISCYPEKNKKFHFLRHI